LFCSLASVVVVCNTPWQRNVTHQGAACDSGPFVLRPIRGAPCLMLTASIQDLVSWRQCATVRHYCQPFVSTVTTAPQVGTIGITAVQCQCSRVHSQDAKKSHSSVLHQQLRTVETDFTYLPALLMNPASASGASHSSQRKQFGCQLQFIALMTRPMMNSSDNTITFHGLHLHL